MLLQNLCWIKQEILIPGQRLKEIIESDAL